jgi:O-antigen/teichoic acid export membrane protein
MMSRDRIAKIKRNAMSLLAGDVLHKASTFCVYALLGRHADINGFGQVSYALALMYLFNVFGAAGLPVLLTRNVAKDRSKTRYYLYNGYLAAAVPSLVATVAMVLFAFVMRYERDTIVVISVMSLAIFPYAMTLISEAVIRGREEMHLVAISNIPGNVLMVAASAFVLLNGYGVIVLAAVIAVSRLLTFIVSNYVVHQTFRGEQQSARVAYSAAWSMLKDSMVFLGSDGINALWHSIDAMILSKFASVGEIGLLQSSFQLLQPALMVYRSVGHGSFPALVEAAHVGPEKIAEISRSLIGYMLRLSLPAAVAMFVLAEDILVTVYGNEEFRAGAIALQILSITLVSDLIKPVFGHGLWAVSREKSVLKIVVVNLLLSCVTGLVLISQFGLPGAACSVLVSSLINVAQHNWYFQRQVVRMPLWREGVKVLPGAIVLVACVVLIPAHRYVSLTIGVLAYFLVAFPQLRQPFLKTTTRKAVVAGLRETK